MAYMTQLQWIKCDGDQWCSLMNVNLAHPHFNALDGVYIIWHGGQRPHTVYVGQGQIANRLAAHRQEPAILLYSHLGLFVTWARCGVERSGVERYLANVLHPLVTQRVPELAPIQANLPW